MSSELDVGGKLDCENKRHQRQKGILSLHSLGNKTVLLKKMAAVALHIY